MNPQQDNGRGRQLATLADIEMVAQNLGQIEQSHRQLVGNINDIIQWIRSIDQVTFLAIHFQVNGSLEFTEETAQRTVDYITQGRAAMEAYNSAQDEKKKQEALAAMGDDFKLSDGKHYKKTEKAIEQTSEHPAGVSYIYTMDLKTINEQEFEMGAQIAFGEKKAAEEKAEQEATEEKATAESEARQAPAEPAAPADIASNEEVANTSTESANDDTSSKTS